MHKACQFDGSHPVVLIGFSVRGLAESVHRAGFRLFAVDHFGDHDLRAIAESVEVFEDWGQSTDAVIPPSQSSRRLSGPQQGFTPSSGAQHGLGSAEHAGAEHGLGAEHCPRGGMGAEHRPGGAGFLDEGVRDVEGPQITNPGAEHGLGAKDARAIYGLGSEHAGAEHGFGEEDVGAAKDAGAEQRFESYEPGPCGWRDGQITRQHTSVPQVLEVGCSRVQRLLAAVDRFEFRPRSVLASLDQELDQSAKSGAGSSCVPVLLAGGTETWPELIEALETRFFLMGANSTQLRQLRNPVFCQQLARSTGICSPSHIFEWPTADTEVQKQSVHDNQRPPTIRWLQKSLSGGGGTHVRRIRAAAERTRKQLTSERADSTGEESQGACRDAASKSVYYQQEILGRTLGVTCILYESTQATKSKTEEASVDVLGVVESWSREDWPGPTEFIYRGCWGPVTLKDEQLTAVQRLAERVALATGLVGWLQMDLVEDEEGRLWLLEFNPRWASSMEILAACNHQPLEKHLAAFSDRFSWQSAAGPSYQTPLECNREHGAATASKGIVYAGRDLMLEAAQVERLHCLPRANFADLPALEQCDKGRVCFTAGQPVVTVRNLITGDNLSRVHCRSSHLAALRELAEQFWLVTKCENGVD